MPELADSAVSPKDIGTAPEDIAKRWHMEIKLARKSRDKWWKRSRKIVQRYRDERASDDEQVTAGVRFNVLWSNVQTLLPAVYAKAPKPVVERRFLDRDPVGRTASRILERCLAYIIEAGYFHEAIRKAVLDYLLPGQGVLWARYEPTYQDGAVLTDTKLAEQSEPAEQIVADEMVCTDYVHFEDFLTNAARTCDELRWKARRAFLTRDKLKERFGEIGSEVPLNYSPKDLPKSTDKTGALDGMFKLAEVWEIWNLDDKKVYFISEHYNKPLEVADDPLKLECFWPSPDPLLATIANDSIVPTPDYVEYQDQAMELDSLTARIAALTKAIKAVGVYDASVPALKRILEEGTENTLYPIDSWAQFAQKGGVTNAVELLPIKEMAEVLIRLYEARSQVKADLYEITGISDIIRGQAAQGGAKTATEQRIKGQFANLRLSDRQAAVATFARDHLRILAEIIAEHFSPQTLLLMSAYEQWGLEDFLPPQAPQQPPQQPPGAAPGQPPQPGTPPMGQSPQMAPPEPPPDPQQQAMERFQAAIDLLKKDKLRGFRVDIETDSTIEPDAQMEKQARVEFLGAVAQFLPQALEAAAQQPVMAPLMGKMLLFGVRGFRVGRDLESAMEETIARLEKLAANPPPPPPNPDMVKAEAEVQSKQMDAQIKQQQAQMETQQRQQEMEFKAQEHQMDLQFKMQEHELEIQFKREEMALQAQQQQQKAALDQQSMQTKMQMDQQKMANDVDIAARRGEQELSFAASKHESEMEQAKQKAEAARKAEKEKPAA